MDSSKQKNALKPLNEVQKRQPPLINGQPYKMNEYSSDLPKNCGLPWLGAYSKHGFWFKFRLASKSDFEKIVANAFETDSFHLNYENLELWKKIFVDQFRFVVARNLRDESMGGISVCDWNDYTVIGSYYVMENYRHSGIGEKLFRDSLESVDKNSVQVVFHAISHLVPKVSRFGLSLEDEWIFDHYVVSNPTGYLSLQKHVIEEKDFTNLTENEIQKAIEFDTRVTSLAREEWMRSWLAHSQGVTKIGFSDKKVVGICQMRETAGEHVRRLLIGPLYANSTEIASQLLFSIFSKFYKPEEDYDFDPDIFAIYRREVHFIIPRKNVLCIELLRGFAGSGSNIRKERLYYQTAFSQVHNFMVDFKRIYAISDLHSCLI